MQDFSKVNSLQLYRLWKDMSVGLLTLIVMMACSKILAPYFVVVAGLACAAFLYGRIYRSRVRNDGGCLLGIYVIFVCLLVYSFVVVVLNVLHMWAVIKLPLEMCFLQEPFLPSLYLGPVCFFTCLVLLLCRRNLSMCMDCKLRNGGPRERGKLGAILDYESTFQLRNFLIVFGVLTIVTWGYYLIYYIDINLNQRDWYVFIWFTIILFVLDEVYFMFRYYNLYLGLTEGNEVVTPEDLKDMTARTYLRYYVICEDSIYLDSKSSDLIESYREVIDTPFVTRRNMSGVSIDEVKTLVHRMSGCNDGELRFFYGRKSNDMRRQSLLRYFYFLDGKVEDHTPLKAGGEWVPFDVVKRIYSTSPSSLGSILVSDISRMSTIMLTSKIFDEEGRRKVQIRSYRPSFSLKEVRSSRMDFQDDRWIRVSIFNSDTPFFRLKKWWHKLIGRQGSTWKE